MLTNTAGNSNKVILADTTRQREIIALDRQGTQQQRPDSPTVTPQSLRVNTRYVNSTKGTFSDTC